MKHRSTLEKTIPLIAGAGITLILILLINRDFPYVGHDYRYFISRLIDTDLHIRQNGLSIQWYSPSFASGLPAYPNPQHLEYSLVQWLTYWLGPWNAILLTTTAFALIGYYYFYQFLHDRLELHYLTSTLGAMFFIGNGFYIEHMIAGHLGFQIFPLGSLILYILTDTKHKIILKAMSVALLLALMIYHAGFITAIILGLSFWILLPIVYLYKPGCLNPRQLILTGVVALVLAVGISSSKLYAVSAFMRYFPRYIDDFYDVSVIQGLIGIVAQLLGMMTLAPLAMITGTDTELLSGALSNITGAKYGIWELDIALSPVLLFFLFHRLASSMSVMRKSGMPKLERRQIPAILLLLTAIWLNLELTLAKGLLYGLTKELPIFESLHVNARFAAVFVVPLIILGSFQIDRFLRNKPALSHFFILAALTIAGTSSYFFLTADLHSRHLDLSPLKVLDERMKNGERFPVEHISDVEDIYSFLQNASSYQTYEVLFGYSLEYFHPETHIGSVFNVNDGYFNITNPVSLVFPELNATRPFERIRVSERDKLNAFVSRGQPDWVIPPVVDYFNFLSLATFVICITTLLLHLTLRVWQRIAITN